jgi:hypothetical protein
MRSETKFEMSLQTLRQAWNQFFFTPQSPIPISIFRALYGTVVTAALLLLHADWLNWYGVHSWVTLATMGEVEPGTRLNLFHLLPQDDSWIGAFFWLSLAFAVLLTIGLFTRVSSVAVFLALASIHQRNLFITHGGDTFLRVAGFFLMFAPAGAAFSVDRIIRMRAGKNDSALQFKSPWAQRMIQFELALLYFTSFWWKSMGTLWVNGTALYYVSQLDELRRFPLPAWMQTPPVLKLGTWFTLALEFSLGTLIWFKELRYPLLLVGLLFHLILEYRLNVPMFEWDVLTAYVLFVDASDLRKWGNSLQRGQKRLMEIAASNR